MAAEIETRGQRAKVKNGVWVCSSPELSLMLADFTADWQAPLGDPNPDGNLADAVVREWGGRVIWCDETEYVAGRVY